MNSQNLIFSVFFLLSGVSITAHAQLPDCEKKQNQTFEKSVCQNNDLNALNSQIKEKYLSAQLMSNASLALLSLAHEDWIKYVKSCKNRQCIQQQFEQRLDDLTFIINMNQSLMQHFVRYDPQQKNQQMVTLQLQQLDKNKIKIEAMQYRNPNNSEHQRIAYLRSYTSPDLTETIVDLETKCHYSINRFGHVLEFKTEDQKCKRFIGIYRLFD